MKKPLSKLKYVFNLTALGVLILISGWAPSAQAGVSISLSPNVSNVAPAGVFTVDVNLNNPSLDSVYGIGIWLKYDAALLNVLDYDSGNWVTAGTNILDGPYHTSFNFPGESYAPNKNDANTDGAIWWMVSESDSQWTERQTPSGTFATIKFQAEGPLGTANLWFDGLGTGGSPDTFVLSKETGENILDNTSGATVNVVPEPGSFILTGLGLFGLFGFCKNARKGGQVKMGD